MTKTKLAKHEIKQVGIGKVVKALQEGKGAKRMHWKNSCIRLWTVHEGCPMTKPFIYMSPLLDEDILAFDWVIVP